MTGDTAEPQAFSIGGRRVLLCSCGGTVPLDGTAIARLADGIGLTDEDGAEPRIHHALCLEAPATLRRLGAGDAPPLIACGQEVAALRAAWAASGAQGEPLFADIRDAGGWSDEADRATPKMLALLAAALVETPAPDLLSVGPSRAVVVLGHEQQAVGAAARLAENFDVTLVLEPGAEVLPSARASYRTRLGRLRAASGAIGRFHLDLAEHAVAAPWSRDRLLPGSQVTAGLAADLVLDLRGVPGPFPAARLGWLRADPARPGAVAEALLDLQDMAGAIAVPRAVEQRRERCVHAAAGRVTCTRCLDVCPTGALTSAGAAVALDPLICGGCGGCAAVCPTAALRYAAPPLAVTLRRAAVLLNVYRAAGGEGAVLLLHDGGASAEALAALARRGPGLPAHVLPLAVPHPTQLGAEPLLTMLALGAMRLLVWDAGPDAAAEGAGLRTAMAMAEAMLAAIGFGAGRLGRIDEQDPLLLCAALGDDPCGDAVPPAEALDLDSAPEARLRASLDHLAAAAGVAASEVALPSGAPCGGVDVSAACTLCLACTRACPTGALEGEPRSQVLTFQESACVQCGLCAAVCPEQAITLRPRLAPDAALRRVLVQDEVAICAKCGRPYGGRRTIDRVIARLRQVSPGLPQRELDRLRSCDACRIGF